MKFTLNLILVGLWLISAANASTEVPFNLGDEFSVEDTLTAASIFVSALMVLLGWHINERQKRNEHIKQYADNIRNSAGKVIAKLERRIELIHCFFRDIQPIIVESEKLFKNSLERNRESETIFYLHLNLLEKVGELAHNFAEEQIEDACKDLYSYPPIVKDLLDTLKKIKYLDGLMYSNILQLTERDVAYTAKLAAELSEKKKNEDPDIYLNYLANRLRLTTAVLRYLYEDLMLGIIGPFKTKTIKLIELSDGDIYNNVEFFIDKNISDAKREKAQILALKGLDFCYQEKYCDAICCFTDAIKSCPSVGGFWAGKCLALRAEEFKKGIYEVRPKSETICEKSVKFRPGSISALEYGRGKEFKSLFLNP